MISSKELLKKTGISRATMNNYIALGILPKLVVRKAEEGSGERAQQLGYFPDDALDRVAMVRRLKKEGLNMSEIAARMDGLAQTASDPGDEVAPSETDDAAKQTPRREADDHRTHEHFLSDVIEHRGPILTPVCSLVATVQNSMNICAELPPEEYFEMINQIWKICETVLRKYRVTQGRHMGNGMVSYFLPQSNSNYLNNALLAADDLRRSMRQLSEEWRLRKQWSNELYLNIGLNEGDEWFGSYHTATNIEFTVLGDSINHAQRLSDFAGNGAIWVTKNLIGKLTPEERARIRFGIRRIDEKGCETWIPETYSRLSNLIDPGSSKYESFRDIATLTVAEVEAVAPDDSLSRPQD